MKTYEAATGLMEKRRNSRYEFRSPILISFVNNSKWHKAQTVNNCQNGMCFKSGLMLRPGVLIIVRIDKISCVRQKSKSASELRTIALGQVQWCEKEAGLYSYLFKAGIHYFAPYY